MEIKIGKVYGTTTQLGSLSIPPQPNGTPGDTRVVVLVSTAQPSSFSSEFTWQGGTTVSSVAGYMNVYTSIVRADDPIYYFYFNPIARVMSVELFISDGDFKGINIGSTTFNSTSTAPATQADVGDMVIGAWNYYGAQTAVGLPAGMTPLYSNRIASTFAFGTGWRTATESGQQSAGTATGASNTGTSNTATIVLQSRTAPPVSKIGTFTKNIDGVDRELTMKRWTGSSLETLNLKGYEILTASPSRYWDASVYSQGIANATTLQELSAVSQDMEDAYGLAVNLLTSATTIQSYTGQPADFSKAVTKESFATVLDELSKYPIDFIQSCSVTTSMVLTGRIIHNPAGTGAGGVAFGTGVAWIASDPNEGSGQYVGTVWRNAAALFHHELNHLIYYSFTNHFEGIKGVWQSLNVLPYSVTYDESLGRPQGFIRAYSRVSYLEDLADTWAAMFTTSMQPLLKELIATDPIVAAKVRMLKEFIASQNAVMANRFYFQSIHGELS